MATTPIQQAGEDAAAAIGSYDPENLRAIQQIFPDFEEMFSGLAQAVGALSGRLEEGPLYASLIEGVNDIAGVLAGLSDTAGELHKQFLQVHTNDLERLDTPRPGEHMADFAANQE